MACLLRHLDDPVIGAALLTLRLSLFGARDRRTSIKTENLCLTLATSICLCCVGLCMCSSWLEGQINFGAESCAIKSRGQTKDRIQGPWPDSPLCVTLNTAERYPSIVSRLD